MAVLVQRLATTDCQLMMAGVTTTMTMERNPFPEKEVTLDLDQFGSCVYLPTHPRCSAIISLMHPLSGPSSLDVRLMKQSGYPMFNMNYAAQMGVPMQGRLPPTYQWVLQLGYKDPRNEV